ERHAPQGREEKERIGARVNPEGGAPERPDVEDLEGLDDHQRGQRDGPRGRERSGVVQFPAEQQQGAYRGQQSCDGYSLPEDSREDRFRSREWLAVEHVTLRRLEREGDVL